MTREEIQCLLQDLMARAHAAWGPRCGDGPQIRMNLRGRAAGQARCGVIRLNPALLNDHPDQWKPTLIHELAHVLAARLFPGCRPHGLEWRRINLELGGVDSVCHSMDTTRHRVRRTRYFEYLTSSGARVWLSSVRHRRAQARLRTTGDSGYRLRRNQELILEWTGTSELR
ncbi:MAG: SprT-like domain-containing protein [Xanthomonadales bacterium]|nr:SprT-like domain-containing protein [Xanthomonadales bacterium]